MKKILFSLAFAFASLLSIGASAQTATNYSNSVYGLSEARSFEYNGWLVVIKYSNNTESSFSNNALTLFNAIRAAHGSTTVTTKFTQVTGTNVYINTSMAYGFFCSNNKTQINWNNSGIQEFEDNCELFNKVKAASINPLNY